MTKKELKTGMIVQLRNGEEFYVVRLENEYIDFLGRNLGSKIYIGDYSNELKHINKREKDVIKVYDKKIIRNNSFKERFLNKGKVLWKGNKGLFNKKLKEKYYFIQGDGSLYIDDDIGRTIDENFYNVANYCCDKEIMIKRAKEEVLNRLLWRFTYENGWTDNWEFATYKYFICCNYNKKYKVDISYCEKNMGVVYFISKEVAQRAIDEIIIPFEKGELPCCSIWEN